ncbi:TMV resistance protein N-like [Lycium ferocissimum]|uniref:TMV resistance protein N-like n=1 Tax=Lycium ferocissimum TaxID=112874 RepID=UPI00281679BD|nr:TMV resistance protein N-like [Lycium ferocissimum]
MATSSDKHDVFLSFRGEDTRKNFVSHLYEALDKSGINTFKDDKKLEKGTSIPEELPKAIDESKFAIVVFSMNYATSGWCLDELVRIIEGKIQRDLTVVPIFYGVNRYEVGEQRKMFAEAFDKHEANVDREKVQIWRNALCRSGGML